MGSNISVKYDNVQPSFDLGLWKVHDAISKSTGKKVSLWLIDYQIMKQKDRNKKNRRKYLQHCQNALQLQQKIQHDHVLKIIEIDAARKKIGFASEHVSFALSQQKKYTRDEFMYITQQIALTMKFLHQHNVVFLGISPDNIFVDEFFSVKLGLFTHTVLCQEKDIVTDPFMNWQPNSIYHHPANFCAPEIVFGQNITYSADVYMFALTALYVYNGEPPSNATSGKDMDTTIPLVACANLPKEYEILLKNCLALKPVNRPNFANIVQDDAFSSLVSGVFEYFGVIFKKESSDLYKFFKGLKKIIGVFSFRIIRQKFLPVFIHFIKKDERFAIVLLPMILKIHRKFNEKQFFAEVLQQIQPILSKTDPPEIPLMLIDHLGIFLKRVPSQSYNKFVYPIILNSLKSTYKNVLSKVIEVFPHIISIISVEDLENEFVPALMSMIERSPTPEIANGAITSAILCMIKTGPDFMAERAVPSIIRLWEKTHWEAISDTITDLIMLMNLSEDSMMSSSVLLASDLLSYKSVPTATQARLITFIRGALNQIEQERNIPPDEMEMASSLLVKDYDLPTEPLKDQSEEEEEENEEEEKEEENTEIVSHPIQVTNFGTRRMTTPRLNLPLDLSSINHGPEPQTNASNMSSTSPIASTSSIGRNSSSPISSPGISNSQEISRRFSISEKDPSTFNANHNIPPIKFPFSSIEDDNSESSLSSNMSNFSATSSPRSISGNNSQGLIAQNSSPRPPNPFQHDSHHSHTHRTSNSKSDSSQFSSTSGSLSARSPPNQVLQDGQFVQRPNSINYGCSNKFPHSNSVKTFHSPNSNPNSSQTTPQNLNSIFDNSNLKNANSFTNIFSNTLPQPRTPRSQIRSLFEDSLTQPSNSQTSPGNGFEIFENQPPSPKKQMNPFNSQNDSSGQSTPKNNGRIVFDF